MGNQLQTPLTLPLDLPLMVTRIESKDIHGYGSNKVTFFVGNLNITHLFPSVFQRHSSPLPLLQFAKILLSWQKCINLPFYKNVRNIYLRKLHVHKHLSTRVSVLIGTPLLKVWSSTSASPLLIAATKRKGVLITTD